MNQLKKENESWMRILGYADWEREDFRNDILNGKINWEFSEAFLTFLISQQKEQLQICS